MQKMELGWKIKALREGLGLKRADVARRAGISYDYLSKIERGERSPNVGVLGRVAAAMGMSLERVISGESAFPAHGVPYPAEEWGLWRLGPAAKIPVIGWASAGEWDEATDSGFQPGDADEWVYSEGGEGGGRFALRVEGDSMAPEFEEGDVIIIDPERAAVSGDCVVAKLVDVGEAVFKQLKRRRGKTLLHPLNPAYPDLAIGPDMPAAIVGPVVEKKTFFPRDPRKDKLGAIIERVRKMSPDEVEKLYRVMEAVFPEE